MTGFKKIFLDTSPFIYYLEDNKMYVDKLRNFFTDCYENRIEIMTSVVTVEEYTVIPYRNNDLELVENFKNFIKCMEIRVIPVDFNLAEKAAQIRAKYRGFKGMDALQLACAVENKCDLFLTNDKQLRQEKEIPCVMLDDFKKMVYAK